MPIPVLAALAATTLSLPALPALAGETGTAPEPFIYGYAQLMNNYVSRGLSQSIGQPSASTEIDVNPGPGIYGNLSATRIEWVDSVYRGASVPVEVDGVIAYRALFEPDVVVEAGVVRLEYPGHYPRRPGMMRPDTTELFGRVRWSWFRVQFNYDATEAYGTPDSRGSSYLDLSATVPVSASWTLSAHVGRSNESGSDPLSGKRYANEFSYTDYKLSATRDFGAGVSFALAFTWTTAAARAYTLDGYNNGGPQLTATIEKDF